MGAVISTKRKAARARERSMAIDKQIEDDAVRMRKDIKVLVLGTQGSGKSTIVKQMKIVMGGYTSDEMAEVRLVIYTDLVHLAKRVILTMREIGVECVEEINRAGAEKILEYEVGSDTSFRLAPDVANAIESLWKDPIITTVAVMDHCSDPDLFSTANYFFPQVQRIAQRDYMPCEADLLRASTSTPTNGIDETKLQPGNLSIRVFEVGGLGSERKKWIHCFEATTSILFCAALSDYDQVLPEDRRRNRMTDSLALFESVVNSRWFSRTSILLFLTKVDLFKAKLSKVPMEKYFPGYTGGSDINKAAKYILWRYKQVNRAMLCIYPHLTQATDTSNIRLVISAIKDTTLQNALREAGIL